MNPADRIRITTSLRRLLRNLGSDHSRKAYEEDWKRYRAWLATQRVDVLKAKPGHVEDHIQHLQATGCKRSTCGRALSVIRAVYSILVRDEVMKTNPAREIKNPKFDSRPNTPSLNEDQMPKLLVLPGYSWIERRNHLVLCLLFGLGWRRSEVAAIRCEDFLLNSITGIVKGKKQLTVGVPEWLQFKIENWKDFAAITEGPLLPKRQGNRKAISASTVYKIVKDAAERAGLPLKSVTPHALRRTNITLGGERGISLKERQLSVGHASQSTTERYDQARNAAKSAPGRVFEDLIPPDPENGEK